MHVIVGIPLYNVMPVESYMSLNNLLFEMLTLSAEPEFEKRYGKFSFSFANTKGMIVDQARNNLVARLLAEPEGTHLLFVDSDMVLPANFFVNMLRTDTDIVTALAFKKWYPHQPTIYKFEDNEWKSIITYPQDSVFEIDGCGMACCLIKKEVFQKVPEPWFEFKMTERGGKHWILSEDIVFCEKAKKAGCTIKVDTGIACGHVGGVIDERTYMGIKSLTSIDPVPLGFVGNRDLKMDGRGNINEKTT